VSRAASEDAAPEAALQPFRPGVDGPWDRAAAAHLVRRASFGMAPEAVERALGLGPEAAAADLLAARPEPEDVAFTQDAAGRVGSIESARAAWVYRMLFGANPAREKLTLFWHGHFATSQRKVEDAGLMVDQVALFRERGAGSFLELLQAVSRDPAMLVWLDGNLNRRGQPNENYARELMELFSLGIGNYTEADIKEAARAFTGWHVKERRFWLNDRAHDPGEKRVFGKTGPFGGEDIVRLCVEHAASPRHIASKLYAYYVQPAPGPELREALGRKLRASGFEIGPFLTALLSSRAFHAPGARRSLVAAPVDFTVGTLRTLGGRASPSAVVKAVAAMGQELYAPPSVKGWDTGMAWLSSTTLLGRYNFALSVVGTEGVRESRDLAAAIPWDRLPATPGGMVARLFPEGLAPATEQAVLAGADGTPRSVTAACLQLPEYQFV
jgi:uncharacterized protein (DUF1800 family)